MRQLARRVPPPRAAQIWTASALLAAVVLLWAVPALATPASEEAQPPPCPSGLARVASWEPIEVLDGVATVAFVLAPGCQGVDMSLVSYQTRQAGAASAPVLQAVTGRFSSGTVNKLMAVVGSDCAFRVVFATGRPDTVGRPGTVVEASMQAPDPCMFGADPVVVTGPTTTAAPALAEALAPATSLAPRAPAASRPAAPEPAPTRARVRPAATTAAGAGQRARGLDRDGDQAATAAPATAAAAPPATTRARAPAPSTISGLASEPVAAVGVGPSGPLAGWDAASLAALAAVTLGVGLAVLWAARSPHPAHARPRHARQRQRPRHGRRRRGAGRHG